MEGGTAATINIEMYVIVASHRYGTISTLAETERQRFHSMSSKCWTGVTRGHWKFYHKGEYNILF